MGLLLLANGREKRVEEEVISAESTAHTGDFRRLPDMVSGSAKPCLKIPRLK